VRSKALIGAPHRSSSVYHRSFSHFVFAHVWSHVDQFHIIQPSSNNLEQPWLCSIEFELLQHSLTSFAIHTPSHTSTCEHYSEHTNIYNILAIISNASDRLWPSSSALRSSFPCIGRRSVIFGHWYHPWARFVIVSHVYQAKNNDLHRLFEGHERVFAIFWTPQREHEAP
jgi:hypothetical protein